MLGPPATPLRTDGGPGGGEGEERGGGVRRGEEWGGGEEFEGGGEGWREFF